MLTWETGTPLLCYPSDTLDELFFLFGPQFLRVSRRKEKGLWPRRALVLFPSQFYSWKGRRQRQQAVRLCSVLDSLAASSPVSGRGRQWVGVIPPEMECLELNQKGRVWVAGSRQALGLCCALSLSSWPSSSSQTSLLSGDQ